MTEDRKKMVSAFRFGVVSDFVNAGHGEWGRLPEVSNRFEYATGIGGAAPATGHIGSGKSSAFRHEKKPGRD